MQLNTEIKTVNVDANIQQVRLESTILGYSNLGIPGKDAYEIAVRKGYVGTEEEWLLSLVGPQGLTGPQGIQGEQGLKGDTGSSGVYIGDTEPEDSDVWINPNGESDKILFPYYQTKTSLDATLIVSTMYEIGTLTGNVSMALPSGTTRQRICVKFNCTGTPYTFTLTGTNFTTFSLTPVANTCYDVEFEYNGATSKWTGYVNSYLA